MILIDEFSTGIDAKMKRDMWSTLKNVAHGKAIVITTRTSSYLLLSLAPLLVLTCSRPTRRLDGRSLDAREQGRHHRQTYAR